MRAALILLAAGVLPLMNPLIATGQAPAPSALWQRPTVDSQTMRLRELSAETRAPDHRWEGMAIGAGAGALGFGLLGAAVCSQSESTDSCTGTVVGVGLLGAFVGGITGGLIGGAIPKGEPADST